MNSCVSSQSLTFHVRGSSIRGLVITWLSLSQRKTWSNHALKANRWIKFIFHSVIFKQTLYYIWSLRPGSGISTSCKRLRWLYNIVLKYIPGGQGYFQLILFLWNIHLMNTDERFTPMYGLLYPSSILGQYSIHLYIPIFKCMQVNVLCNIGGGRNQWICSPIIV